MKIKDLTSQSTKTGAGALIYAQETEQFLFILRSSLVNSPLTWGLPGGRTDPGENTEETMKRELAEECGFSLDNKKYPYTLVMINREYAPRFEFYTYAVVIDKPFNPDLNWESENFKWCTLDEIPNPLHPGVALLLANDSAGEKLHKFIQQHQS